MKENQFHQKDFADLFILNLISVTLVKCVRSVVDWK